jgi:hypothetical protein
MADSAEILSGSRLARQFVVGFFHPELFGAYVLIAMLSAGVGAAYYFGYGCLFRIGGLLFLVFVPALAAALLLVVFGGWLQSWLWRGPLKQGRSAAARLSLFESFCRTLMAAAVCLLASSAVGSKLCDARARKICAHAVSLIAEVERAQKQQGTYPTNTAALVRSKPELRRKYRFYYGDWTTNGVDWTPDRIASADISFFVTTNRFQCVVPIERMSPITFSSFRVYCYTSEHPAWNRTLLHWSLLGAYIDQPEK